MQVKPSLSLLEYFEVVPTSLFEHKYGRMAVITCGKKTMKEHLEVHKSAPPQLDRNYLTEGSREMWVAGAAAQDGAERTSRVDAGSRTHGPRRVAAASNESHGVQPICS